MPHRSMNSSEAAAYLHLSPADVAMLVKRDEIPHAQQGGRVVFRRAELEAWASQRILGLSTARLSEYHSKSSSAARSLSPGDELMTQLLTVDRIAPALSSRTKSSAIHDMVALAETTDLVSDPRELLQTLEDREKLCSTALPGGFALLHPRQHDPYMFAESFAVLGKTVQPIHFGAEDGRPTDLFFLICCQNDRLHLHTLARLCTMAQRTSLLDDVREAGSSAEMLDALIDSERQVINHPHKS